MSIDYRQLYPQIQQLAEQMKRSALSRCERVAKVQRVLEEFALEVEFLQRRVEAVVRQEGLSLRCAKPFETPLNACYSQPSLLEAVNLAAADGSQLLPDRHAELYFGLIHVGGVILPRSLPLTPREYSQSELWYAEVEDFNESLFNFRRDVLERQLLLQISLSLAPPTLALVDGPLELWLDSRLSEEEKREWQHLFGGYLDVLRAFHERKILLSGYIDRPESTYVVRLLELAIATPQDLDDFRRFRPFKGVLDADLFLRLLRPGERSAIFGLQSPWNECLPLEESVCFFYLHVGGGVMPSLARVEIPRWLATEPSLVDQLHAALLSQCRQSGAYPYPYPLHRAHEVAVVRPEDRETIVRALSLELQRGGHRPGQPSHKQALKNLSWRPKEYLS